MNTARIKQQWRDYLGGSQNMAAFIVALFALLIISSVLFKNPRPSVIDYGAYTQTMYELGLYQLDPVDNGDTDNKDQVITEEYGIKDLSFLKLLQLEPARTLVYPVRLICLFCKLFAIPFSTMYLAVLLMGVTVFCIYSLIRSLFCYFGEYTAAIGILICIILLDGNHLIYFNSLYNDGIFYVSLLLFITVLLHIITNDRNAGIYPVLKLILSALLLINSNDMGILLLPFSLAAIGFAIYYCIPVSPGLISYFLISLLAVIFLIRANVLYTAQNNIHLSHTQIYHGLFTGILPNTNEPEEILKELELPPQLIEDIGKNAYLPEDGYVISPYSQEAENEIYSKITYGTFFKTYWKHPEILKNLLDKTAANTGSILSSHFAYVGRTKGEGVEWVERHVVWEWIRKIIVPESVHGYFFLFLLNQFFGIFLVIRNKAKREAAILGILYLLFVDTALLLFLGTCLLNGLAEVSLQIHYFIIILDVLWLILFSTVIYYLRKLTEYLTWNRELDRDGETAAAIEDYEEVLNQKNPLLLHVLHKTGQLRNLAALHIREKSWIGAGIFAALGLLVMILVMYCPRIGAYNNGDFGRMMEAMNIQYTQEDWKTPEELSLTKVVETYDWVEQYDYTKIMFFHADLSQAFLSFVLKLADNYIGFQFSTVYVSIIYVIILMLCFYTIMRTLFHRFGLSVSLWGFLLILVLFDRDNLGWLNSLFGEGPAFVGLMMVTASSLYVIQKERGTCRMGFLALLFSCMFFAGTKAQFTVTALVLLPWILLLGIYHAPRKVWRIIFYSVFLAAGCAYITLSLISIYKKNENISSQDTIYQSIFYGLLLISDDPKGDLAELGLDPALSADAGKHAYLDKSEYYCPPRTEMAEEMIYSKVNTFTILKFYLRHPKKLWIMMDEAAKAAAKPLPDYVLYTGQKTTGPHDLVSKNDYWQTIRPYVTPDRFWQLILIYGLVITASFSVLLGKKHTVRDKLLIGLYLLIAAIGIIQFPLSTIGNGLADNTKQLYLYRLTYDLTVILGCFMLLSKLKAILSDISLKLLKKTSEKLRQE